MKTIWVGKTANRNLKSSLRVFVYHLFVDVVAIVLLLAAMAYGMAYVSYEMTEPHSVELQVMGKPFG